MANLEVRRAEPRDLPLIFRGERQYMEEVEPGRLDAWVNAIDRNLQLWIDNLDHAVIGMIDDTDAGYAIWQWDRPDVTLVTIHVFSRFRGRGAGRQLLGAVIREVSATDAPCLRLNVAVHNGARRLYERAGFQQRDVSGASVGYALDLHDRGNGLPETAGAPRSPTWINRVRVGK